MHGKGVCVAGGMHDRGHAWQGYAWWGACMAGGMAGETTTAADGTHPAGMHSCRNNCHPLKGARKELHFTKLLFK